jgi:hypothetical protein
MKTSPPKPSCETAGDQDAPSSVTLALEEMLQQLNALAAMCLYMGWDRPHRHIVAARDALLEQGGEDAA